jgi:hypothetical protein
MLCNTYEAIMIDNTDAIIKDTQRRLIIRVWKDKVSKPIAMLANTAVALKEKLDSENQMTVRGKEKTVHIGCWRKYMSEVCPPPTVYLTMLDEDNCQD